MSVTVDINATDLLKWARHLEKVPEAMKPAIANTLNFVGNSVVDKTVQFIADNTGLDPTDIRNTMLVHQATSDDLTFQMDASQVAPPSLDWSRPWDTKDQSSFDQSDADFDQSMLVKIVTMEDDLVCQLCQDAAEDSPYTLEEAQQKLPIHPNCRCLLQPFYSYRRLPVVFSHEDASGPESAELTLSQLGDELARQLTPVLLKVDDA